ncbi:hypothetical protein AALP_AA6G078200 [Arabis alpina]|uniref:Uncharacterized protein n=1 Tax=Arabis alpina TaxID=50452 RepID=A0A087GMR9_ARAAL|nr:hypothetical protein AALP_AA6G078200 [Arabis alpina]
MDGAPEPEFYEISLSRYGKIICYNQTALLVSGDHKGWENASSLADALPIFIGQILVANLTYRVFYYMTRPLYLPPFVAQLLSGLLFSPTFLGRTKFILNYVLPFRFNLVLETFANLALIYNIFLLGLGIDFRMIRIKELKPVIIASAGLVVAILAGIGLFYIPGNGQSKKNLSGGFYWAVTLGCTNFPDLARILADLKLLRTDMGRTAMCASLITDLCTWCLLLFGFATFSRAGALSDVMPYVFSSTLVFLLLCFYVIRPGIAWAFAHTVKGGQVGETHVWFTLAGVVLSGLITDACGISSIPGAFLFGLSIPHDHIIRSMIEEKLHDFLSGILMPLFYIICGVRVDLRFMLEYTSYGMLAFVISSSFMVKIISTVVCSYFLRIPMRDGLAIGALMNTKGTLALVVLNTGLDKRALDVPMYSHMTLVLLAMSIVGQPLLAFAYKPKKKLVFYKNRTVQKLKGEVELRVLTCVHVLPNVSGITSLLQISNPTKKSALRVFAIHLVELTGRTTTSLLIMNDEAKSKSSFSDRIRAESEQIAERFEAMEVNNEGVMVETITAVSPYATIHEDICQLAEDKRVSFILLPYHKSLTSDGRLDEGNASYADINHEVLGHAPCSVGILVDRGMTLVPSETNSSFHGEHTKREVAMLFVGGRDDREALAYAWRMSVQQNMNLTVVRFIPGREALIAARKTVADYEKETQVDEESIYEFNFNTMDNSSVTYIENVVNDGQETIAAIREMDDNKSFDLYIVGRGYKVESPATAGLTDWTSTTPELGTIGDTLASSNFTMQASVLVIQQYSAANRNEHGEGGANNGHEAKPFMKPHEEDDDEEVQYQMGMRK